MAQDRDIFLLADEDGNEESYRLLFREILNGSEYGVISPEDENSDEGVSIVSIRWSEEKQADELETIDDEAVIDRVYEDFLEAFPDDEEEDPGEGSADPGEDENVYVMKDDEGEEVTFRQISRMEVDGVTYALLALQGDDDDSAMVFVVDTDENGEENLSVADEEIADEIFYLFMSENEDYEYGPAT